MAAFGIVPSPILKELSDVVSLETEMDRDADDFLFRDNALGDASQDQRGDLIVPIRSRRHLVEKRA